jgi:hypothetical protein
MLRLTPELLPAAFFRVLRLLLRTRDHTLYLYFHTCILWMSQTTSMAARFESTNGKKTLAIDAPKLMRT